MKRQTSLRPSEGGKMANQNVKLGNQNGWVKSSDSIGWEVSVGLLTQAQALQRVDDERARIKLLEQEQARREAIKKVGDVIFARDAPLFAEIRWTWPGLQTHETRFFLGNSYYAHDGYHARSSASVNVNNEKVVLLAIHTLATLPPKVRATYEGGAR